MQRIWNDEEKLAAWEDMRVRRCRYENSSKYEEITKVLMTLDINIQL